MHRRKMSINGGCMYEGNDKW